MCVCVCVCMSKSQMNINLSNASNSLLIFLLRKQLCTNANTHTLSFSHTGKEDILINACCPGWVRTDMAGPRAPLTPDQGAETPVMLALLPPGSPSGEFWKDKKVVQW